MEIEVCERARLKISRGFPTWFRLSLPVAMRAGGLACSGATVDDLNPALPEGLSTMGIMVYSSLWVMQDLYHQPWCYSLQGIVV